jgi:hypothetical protein
MFLGNAAGLAPASFVYEDTVFVPTDNPNADAMPFIDAWELQHLGGSLPNAGGN